MSMVPGGFPTPVRTNIFKFYTETIRMASKIDKMIMSKTGDRSQQLTYTQSRKFTATIQMVHHTLHSVTRGHK